MSDDGRRHEMPEGTCSFGELAGLVLTRIEVLEDEIRFFTEGDAFRMFHDQRCCESVVVDSISGNLARLIGEKILDATERSNSKGPKGHKSSGDSETWTWYTIRTQNETVTIRWYGASNGYYSESVDFVRLPKAAP